MVRTQVSLEPEELGWLRRQARKEGTSLADIIRGLIRKASKSKSAPRPTGGKKPMHQRRDVLKRFPFVGCITDARESDAKLAEDYLYGEGEVR